jgi:membrane-associated protein
VLNQIIDLVSGSSWTYAIVLAVAALDALFPVVPSETTVIAAGVVAAVGDLSIALVIAAAAAGAFCGDTSAYLIGRFAGTRLEARWARNPKAARRRDWAAGLLARRGGTLILAGRFIPGGRTAVTITAGLTRFPLRRFVTFAGLAALLWASYAGLLGYAGGHSFEDQPILALLVGLGLAFTVVLLIEAVRRLRHRDLPAA